MADPVLVSIPKGVWKLVAENEVAGSIEVMDLRPNEYLFTTRVNPSILPVIVDPNDAAFEGVPKFLKGRTVKIESNEPTDFYILCLSADGKVKVTA